MLNQATKQMQSYAHQTRRYLGKKKYVRAWNRLPYPIVEKGLLVRDDSRASSAILWTEWLVKGESEAGVVMEESCEQK
jgi:hypothetical protein